MVTIPEAFALAQANHQAGYIAAAEDIYRKILAVVPDHQPSLKRLETIDSQVPLEGVCQNLAALFQLGQEAKAIASQQLVASILAHPRYDDPLRLERFGQKCFSQSDEDGLIQEIFRRIGTTNKVFFEFGVRNDECNSILLLHQGWSGVWLEGSKTAHEAISRSFASVIAAGRLSVLNSFVTRENINEIIREAKLPAEIDMLSIDIDGNDYYIFEAISELSPRLVVIEYNATLPPPTRGVVKYDKDFVWKGTSYFGASLASLAALAERKGYSLVGCNITGVNAFFVRNDLVAGKFQAPFTAENHYQPQRYNLVAGFLRGKTFEFREFEPL